MRGAGTEGQAETFSPLSIRKEEEWKGPRGEKMKTEPREKDEGEEKWRKEKKWGRIKKK